MSYWDPIWEKYGGLNIFGKVFWFNERRTIRTLLENNNLLGKDIKILDVGCGTGRTLSFFRELGFRKSIGIDISKEALKICENIGFRIGKDVFLSNLLKNKLESKKFDLVFSETVLEEYEDNESMIREMCRVSKNFVLVTIPNYQSLYSKLIISLNRKPVEEYEYSPKTIIALFRKYKFRKILQTSFNFNEILLFLFKRQAN